MYATRTEGHDRHRGRDCDRFEDAGRGFEDQYEDGYDLCWVADSIIELSNFGGLVLGYIEAKFCK